MVDALHYEARFRMSRERVFQKSPTHNDAPESRAIDAPVHSLPDPLKPSESPKSAKSDATVGSARATKVDLVNSAPPPPNRSPLP